MRYRVNYSLHSNQLYPVRLLTGIRWFVREVQGLVNCPLETARWPCLFPSVSLWALERHLPYSLSLAPCMCWLPALYLAVKEFSLSTSWLQFSVSVSPSVCHVFFIACGISFPMDTPRYAVDYRRFTRRADLRFPPGCYGNLIVNVKCGQSRPKRACGVNPGRHDWATFTFTIIGEVRFSCTEIMKES